MREPVPTERPAMRRVASLAAVVTLQLLLHAAPAQQFAGNAADPLPEAPTPVTTQSDVQPSPTLGGVAPRYTREIPPGWQAQPLSAGDKVVLGLRDRYSLGSIGSAFIASGYSQLTNGQPNYGTDRGAFGERLGATALREATQGLFTDAVFAPLLHQDPRYYVMGTGHSFVRRALYAATRPLLTRTDDGRTTVNGSLLLGYASAAALSNAYYPQINRNSRDVAATFGTSIGGAALGFGVSEFADELLVKVHLRRPM